MQSFGKLAGLCAILNAGLLVSANPAPLEKRATSYAVGYASADCSGNAVFYTSDANNLNSCVDTGNSAVSVAVSKSAVEFQAVKFYHTHQCAGPVTVTNIGDLPNGLACYRVSDTVTGKINGARWYA